MTLLKSVKPSEASGGIKQIYDGFISKLGKIPNVIQFHTASPSIYGHLMGILNTFSQHPTLDRELLAYLRYIISHRVGGAYCVQFQSYLLKAYGQSDENIAYAVTDLAKLKMDDKKKHCYALPLRYLKIQIWMYHNIYRIYITKVGKIRKFMNIAFWADSRWA